MLTHVTSQEQLIRITLLSPYPIYDKEEHVYTRDFTGATNPYNPFNYLSYLLTGERRTCLHT